MDKSINLNLLRTLQVLLDECHVSRSAERLCITQSAVSRQLSQLREMFDDPLLLREGNRLIPTRKAEQLKPQLEHALSQCQDLLVSAEFSPERWDEEVTLASSDYVAQYIFPDLVSNLIQQAPKLQLSYRQWSRDQVDRLADLPIHLVSTMLPAIPDGLCGRQIGADRPVCVMRKEHPLAAQAQLSVEDVVAYPYIQISAGGDKDSFVDKALAERELQRNIQCRVPFFSSAFQTLCRTDWLMIVPDHIAFNMQQCFPLTYRELPFDTPEHKYWLLWHPKYEQDLGHIWLREQVLQIMQSSMYSIHLDSI